MTDIFVFGSNLAGRHGRGAARDALYYWGAVLGKGRGLEGQSYAIPTKGHMIETLPLSSIRFYVDEFKKFALENQQYTFWVTAVGCGLAGYQPTQIGPMFKDCPSNVVLPTEFKTYV
jgi:hypothetical protein